MLTLSGRSAKFCDGVARRSFLKAGFLGLSGLSLADLLRLKAQAAGNSARGESSVIFVELAGGPTQFETYDPKPHSPIEYRGEFGIVRTSVPGVIFSELMVEQAKLMDKLSIVRSIHHQANTHDPSSHLSQTGYYKLGPKGGSSSADIMPCFGSIAAKVRGSRADGLPAYVAVPRIMRNGRASYLGKSYNPFETVGDPNQPDFQVQNLSLVGGLNGNRLDDRRSLLAALDRQRRLFDLEGSATAWEHFTRQAFELVTGARARVA
ncbi:MAG: DUF1501 domain-containing protein, partial [Planctomycetes bacterium]|nr:DUF1501 domain-containing protein [Planctomycetota bacterium]